MRLDPQQARARLVAQDHGVLGTVHPVRGVDAVPCVFAVTDGDVVGVPIDRVKPKASQRLQRAGNLDADPRATLLVEHWDAADWSRLWWVRARLERVPDPPAEVLADLTGRLLARYPQYDEVARGGGEPFAGMLALRIVTVTGWAASPEPEPEPEPEHEPAPEPAGP